MRVSEIFERRFKKSTGEEFTLVNYQDHIAVLIDGERVDFDVQVHGNTKIKIIPLFGSPVKGTITDFHFP